MPFYVSDIKVKPKTRTLPFNIQNFHKSLIYGDLDEVRKTTTIKESIEDAPIDIPIRIVPVLQDIYGIKPFFIVDEEPFLKNKCLNYTNKGILV